MDKVIHINILRGKGQRVPNVQLLLNKDAVGT